MSAITFGRTTRNTDEAHEVRRSAAPWRAATIGYAPSTQAPNPQGEAAMLRLYDELFAEDDGE